MAASSIIYRVTRIQHVLNQLYPNPPIPLNYNSPFTLLCAVVLSAQTTDGKVNDVTDVLFKVAPDAYAMAKMDPGVVEKIIKTVGLAPRKSQYLVGLAKRLVEKYEGKVPSEYEDLESLPGVGRKTASVIRSQIFGYPSLAVDTHVHRLALRWKLTEEKTNATKVQQDLCALFPKEHWSKLHLQMIYFGREYCTAKQHENSECPICCWVHKPLHKLQQQDKEASDIPVETDTILTSASFTTIPIHEESEESENTTSLVDHPATISVLDTTQFTPKKIHKGILQYAERHKELVHSPHLTPILDLEAETIITSRVAVVDTSGQISSLDMDITGENVKKRSKKGATTRTRKNAETKESIIEVKNEISVVSSECLETSTMTVNKRTQSRVKSSKKADESLTVNDSVISTEVSIKRARNGKKVQQSTSTIQMDATVSLPIKKDFNTSDFSIYTYESTPLCPLISNSTNVSTNVAVADGENGIIESKVTDTENRMVERSRVDNVHVDGHIPSLSLLSEYDHENENVVVCTIGTIDTDTKMAKKHGHRKANSKK